MSTTFNDKRGNPVATVFWRQGELRIQIGVADRNYSPADAADIANAIKRAADYVERQTAKPPSGVTVFKCAGCGATTEVDRCPREPARPLPLPETPPLGWETLDFWAQSGRTGRVRRLTLHFCSRECVMHAARGTGDGPSETAWLDEHLG